MTVSWTIWNRARDEEIKDTDQLSLSLSPWALSNHFLTNVPWESISHWIVSRDVVGHRPIEHCNRVDLARRYPTNAYCNQECHGEAWREFQRRVVTYDWSHWHEQVQDHRRCNTKQTHSNVIPIIRYASTYHFTIEGKYPIGVVLSYLFLQRSRLDVTRQQLCIITVTDMILRNRAADGIWIRSTTGVGLFNLSGNYGINRRMKERKDDKSSSPRCDRIRPQW